MSKLVWQKLTQHNPGVEIAQIGIPSQLTDHVHPQGLDAVHEFDFTEIAIGAQIPQRREVLLR